jgi:GNAT superfamily N-acetyltransferase
MEIRNPNKTHWPALEPLILAALGPGWDAAALSERIFYDEAYDPNHVWFAREAGQMLGFLHTSLEGETARIKLLVIAPSARRKGLGREMLSRAEDRLVGEGAREALIAPSPPREFYPGLVPGSEAEAFFVAQGYEPDGELSLEFVDPVQPVEPPPLEEGAVDFAHTHAGRDWSWAEEALAHRPPRALYRSEVGLLLFEPGVSVGPLWAAEDADDAALLALSEAGLAAASQLPARDPRGLRLHAGDGALPWLEPARRETRIIYRKALS